MKSSTLSLAARPSSSSLLTRNRFHPDGLDSEVCSRFRMIRYRQAPADERQSRCNDIFNEADVRDLSFDELEQISGGGIIGDMIDRVTLRYHF